MSDAKRMAAATIAPGRAEKTERAIARAIEAVARVPPHVDAVVARAAIVRVTSRTESRNMITNYLAAHSTALVDGGSGAPDPLVRLIEDLIASGFDGVVLPRCFDCGEAMVVSRPDGRIVTGSPGRTLPATIVPA